jgi:tetratricopeptide (TPR) repeat protein
MSRRGLLMRTIAGNSDGMNNWIALGEFAMNSGNYISAEEYAKKILECDVNIGIAWFMKACAAAQHSSRIQESFDCWRKATELMSLEQRKENYETFLYVSTGYGSVIWDDVDKGLTSSTKFDFNDLNLQLGWVIDCYVAGEMDDDGNEIIEGFDNEAIFRMFFDGACFLFDGSKTEDTNRSESMLSISDYMLSNLIYDTCCVEKAFKVSSKLLEIHKWDKKRTMKDYKYDVEMSLKLMLSTRKVRKGSVIFIEYYEGLTGLLSKILSEVSGADISLAEKYWSKEENRKRGDELTQRLYDAENDWFAATDKLIGGQGAKKKALDAIKMAFLEIAYPTKR